MTARWQEDALCREVGAALFFPPDHQETNSRAHRYAEGKTLCARCLVRQACLDDAMTREGDVGHHYRTGLWGGLTPVERADLAHARQSAREAAA